MALNRINYAVETYTLSAFNYTQINSIFNITTNGFNASIPDTPSDYSYYVNANNINNLQQNEIFIGTVSGSNIGLFIADAYITKDADGNAVYDTDGNVIYADDEIKFFARPYSYLDTIPMTLQAEYSRLTQSTCIITNNIADFVSDIAPKYYFNDNSEVAKVSDSSILANIWI